MDIIPADAIWAPQNIILLCENRDRTPFMGTAVDLGESPAGIGNQNEGDAGGGRQRR